MLLKRRRWRG